MKKLILTLTINLLIVSTNIAQIPPEAFPLTNSLSGLWRNGEIDKAIESSLELYRLYPPMFIDRIHNTLAQQLEDDSQHYGLTYLEQLLNKENQEINKIIAPIYLWSKAIVAKEEQELTSIKQELKKLQSDSSNYVSKLERYSLLILKELDSKNATNNEYQVEIIEKNISSLKTYPNIIQIVTDRKESEKRAWHRYLIAYSYNYLYSNVSNKEEYLKEASDFSPDLNDRLNTRAYFHDAALLTGNPRQIGYKTKYQKYLVDNNRKSEALDLLSEITFGEPSDYNLNLLKELYKITQNDKAFNIYWESYIHYKGKTAPQIKIQFEKEMLDLTQKSENWIYIDVWGTWCSPCRKELPELQSLYSENQQMENSKLKIYTFSFGSQNLSDFMTENNYTFPVSEIDKQTNDLFEVSGYPTKILISPEGNFIKIPFGVDWKTYIKNYTMM
ncbi:TlpA family protein disulfide reductase [Aestuariibaculum lutulentum]|uniref:TlpA family protein disulfide reductase n=1 Tax=Aestuariibaculum lutulentum TaxID=2920935 RepID=A0ABS9RME8_9FLAO|nr:TlpA disulfide reductase family protein [Aestuariibaculum lutulentum]MCH4554125.1 TlpA family protein disulfide reductase [Aestuariibaculum lutulentum]